MEDSTKSNISNILLLGSLALFFALLCRWFLMFSTEIGEVQFWTSNSLAGVPITFSGKLGADLYSAILQVFLILFGNRMIGAIMLQTLLFLGGLLLFYFGARNYFEELPAAIGLFLCLLMAHIQPYFFSLGPDELIFLFFTLVFFLISLCTLVENVFLVVLTALLLGIGSMLFPPMLILWIPFLMGERESERNYALSVLAILGGTIAGFGIAMGLTLLISQIDVSEMLDTYYWLPDFDTETTLFRLRTLLMIAPAFLFLMVSGIVVMVTEMMDAADEKARKKKEKDAKEAKEKESKDKENKKETDEEDKRKNGEEKEEKDSVDRAIESIEKAEEMEKIKEAERLAMAQGIASIGNEQTKEELPEEKTVSEKQASEGDQEEDRVYTLDDLPVSGSDDQKLAKALAHPVKPKPVVVKKLEFDDDVDTASGFDHSITEEDMHFDID